MRYKRCDSSWDNFFDNLTQLNTKETKTMIKLRKLIAATLVVAMSVGMSTVSFADSLVTKDMVLKELEQNGIKPTYVIDKNSNNVERFNTFAFGGNLQKTASNTIKVNSIDELNQIIDEIKQFDATNNPANETSMMYSSAYATRAEEVREGNGTVSKWAPLFGTFCWKNISFSFDYKYYPLAGYYIYTNKVPSQWMTSHISGLSAVAVEWNQTSSSANINETGRSVELNVTGYYLFGADFGDFEIGVPVNGEWSMNSKEPEKYID